jgi:hypothetical protein
MGKASALVRVLLEMYFNGKIPEVDLFLKHEVKLAKEYVNLHNGKNSTPRVKPIKKP